MKITFLKAGGWGNAGGDRVIAIHAENLHRRGHDVTVVAVPPPPATAKNRIKSIFRKKPGQKQHPGLFDAASFNKIILDRFRPPRNSDMPEADILVTTWFETAEWAEDLDESRGMKVSFIQGYEAFDFIPMDRLDGTWRLTHPKITISKWLFDLAKEKFDRNDVFLVPNSVNREQFLFKARDKNCIPTVGFLYHTLYSKGVGTCLEVVEKLHGSFEKMNIVTFGHGEFQPSLPENVTLRHFDDPAQASIKDIYAMCDVWLCGSSSEGFHLPPLEAMACGCPVVSTMVGGPLDTIIDGRNGYLAPIGDIDRLAGLVRSILQRDDEDWALISRQAADTGADYSWDDASGKFERCLQEVLDRRSSAP